MDDVLCQYSIAYSGIYCTVLPFKAKLMASRMFPSSDLHNSALAKQIYSAVLYVHIRQCIYI